MVRILPLLLYGAIALHADNVAKGNWYVKMLVRAQLAPHMKQIPATRTKEHVSEWLGERLQPFLCRFKSYHAL